MDQLTRASRAASRAVRRGLAALGTALATQLAPRRGSGWLAQREARATIVSLLLLVVAASLLHQLTTVAVAALLGVCLLLLTGTGWRSMAPLWVGMPLFTLALALPACLNLITPGQMLVVLWRPPWPGLPPEVGITLPGLLVASRFFLRTLACVAFALTLTASLEPATLVNGLRRLGLPRVFGMVLTMMQRYLVMVLQAAEDLHRGRLSRSFGGESVRQGQRWAAAGMGLLLLSTLRMAEGVHQAMLARGYDGDIQVLQVPRWEWREWLLLLGAVMLATALLLWDRGLL